MGRLKTFLLVALVFVGGQAASQSQTPNTAAQVRAHFRSVHQRLLEMAKDFPEEKYEFKLKPEMRSFGAVLVHVASGTVYASKAGRGEKVNWDELDPKNYRTKAAVIALMEKSMADAEATLKKVPDGEFARTVEPWLEVTEHSAEHYGLLVAYYRANGLVPPASRKQ
jgi:hypothetical protein